MSTPINLRGVRGDTKSLNITIDRDGDVVDISDWVFFFTLKRKVTDADEDAIYSKTLGPGQDQEHSNPTDGITLLTIAAEDTDELEGKYHYDIQAKKPDGSIITFAIGEFIFDRDVTRRTV